MQVTPFVGVWIETVKNYGRKRKQSVTPFVGVWIETSKMIWSETSVNSHTLRGCVD